MPWQGPELGRHFIRLTIVGISVCNGLHGINGFHTFTHAKYIYKVCKSKRDILWANNPITITRINEHPHSSNGPPSLLGSITIGFLRVLAIRLHYLQNNAILWIIKFYIKLNGTCAIFNFTTHNKIGPWYAPCINIHKNHIAPKQDHIQIYKQEHMANPVLILSIAITRNRVLGFKN